MSARPITQLRRQQVLAERLGYRVLRLDAEPVLTALPVALQRLRAALCL